VRAARALSGTEGESASLSPLCDALSTLAGPPRKPPPARAGGIELGLERVLRVKDELRSGPAMSGDHRRRHQRQGSTCAYLEAIYSLAGYRVGCYTSPHLLDYNERVRIDRRPISDDALCEAFAKVEAARQAAGQVPLTYFEFGTLAAMEVFPQPGPGGADSRSGAGWDAWMRSMPTTPIAPW
jgi:dihydrofolate synthase/folylpolyglutamate synthase